MLQYPCKTFPFLSNLACNLAHLGYAAICIYKVIGSQYLPRVGCILQRSARRRRIRIRIGMSVVVLGGRSLVNRSVLTPQWVENATDHQYKYCALHRQWHSANSFSTGATGQLRNTTRYCLAASNAQRQDFDESASMVPCDSTASYVARGAITVAPKAPNHEGKPVCLDCPSAIGEKGAPL